MVKIEFYYKSADKDKTEAMREAIDIALFGTNVQCNFKNLPDHLILEDMILEKLLPVRILLNILLVLYIEMIQNINDIVILLLGKNFVMILIILLEMNLQDKQIIYLLKRLLMNMIV